MAEKKIEVEMALEKQQMEAGLDQTATKAATSGDQIKQGLERAAEGAKKLTNELNKASEAGKKLQTQTSSVNWGKVQGVGSAIAGFGMMAVGSRLAGAESRGERLAGGAMQGIGAGIGAGGAIGSMINPVVGGAIGAAVGALVGAGAGLLNASSKLSEAAEAQKAAASQAVSAGYKSFQDVIKGEEKETESEAFRKYVERLANAPLFDNTALDTLRRDIEDRTSKRTALRGDLDQEYSDTFREAFGNDNEFMAWLEDSKQRYIQMGAELKTLQTLEQSILQERIVVAEETAEREKALASERWQSVTEAASKWVSGLKQKFADWQEAMAAQRETVEKIQRGRMEGFSASMRDAATGAMANDLTRIGGGVEGLSGSTFAGLQREGNAIARQSLDQLRRLNDKELGQLATTGTWG